MAFALLFLSLGWGDHRRLIYYSIPRQAVGRTEGVLIRFGRPCCKSFEVNGHRKVVIDNLNASRWTRLAPLATTGAQRGRASRP